MVLTLQQRKADITENQRVHHLKIRAIVGGGGIEDIELCDEAGSTVVSEVRKSNLGKG